MSLHKNYYVYWVTLVFIYGTARTVRFNAKNDLIAHRVVNKLPKFETIVQSYVLTKDTYRQAV